MLHAAEINHPLITMKTLTLEITNMNIEITPMYIVNPSWNTQEYLFSLNCFHLSYYRFLRAITCSKLPLLQLYKHRC